MWGYLFERTLFPYVFFKKSYTTRAIWDLTPFVWAISYQYQYYNSWEKENKVILQNMKLNLRTDCGLNNWKSKYANTSTP
jgi:hypothetical protein